MNDLDNWLNQLGLNNSETATPTSSDTVPAVPSVAVLQQPHEEPAPFDITDDELISLLADNGFQEPEYEEAEEIKEDGEKEEEANTEYNEDSNAERDLDAEEDADWDNLQQAGVITSVIPDSLLSSEEAVQAVQDVNEDYPAHNPDEEVSQDAIEAFGLTEQPESPTIKLLLAPNSSTLLMNDATSRFSGTEWYNQIQKSHVIIAGCGGIGSWTVLQLARMNPEALFLYDDDIVEQANMSGQLYGIEDVGKPKVEAMADMIHSYTTMRNVYAIQNKFTQESEAGDIMICGFDNMKARRTFFGKWIRHVRSKPEEERHRCLYLDGRLSIDTLQVFCITGDNEWALSEYDKNYLFSDAEAEETQCSLKQTTYLACMIGSVIVNLFTNFTANLLNPIIPYDLPFFTEYDAQNMIFKTIK